MGCQDAGIQVSSLEGVIQSESLTISQANQGGD
jgi:hypothetical protein